MVYMCRVKPLKNPFIIKGRPQDLMVQRSLVQYYLGIAVDRTSRAGLSGAPSAPLLQPCLIIVARQISCPFMQPEENIHTGCPICKGDRVTSLEVLPDDQCTERTLESLKCPPPTYMISIALHALHRFLTRILTRLLRPRPP